MSVAKPAICTNVLLLKSKGTQFCTNNATYLMEDHTEFYKEYDIATQHGNT